MYLRAGLALAALLCCSLRGWGQADTVFFNEAGDTVKTKAESFAYIINTTDQNYAENRAVRRYVTNGDWLQTENTFRNGTPHGVWRKWNAKGQLTFSLPFEDGMEQGDFYTYHSNGKQRRHEHFEKGKRTSQHCFDSAGNRVRFFEYLVMPKPPKHFFNYDYINAGMKYPRHLRETYVMGNVIATIVITRTGGRKQLVIKKKLHPELDAQLLDYIGKAGPWGPALLENEPVDATMAIPFRFDTDGMQRIKPITPFLTKPIW